MGAWKEIGRMETILSVEHLMISFSQYERGWRKIQLPVIRDLSINIKGHEIVAVVGSSGSGKSLLAHAVMGLLPANASWKGRIAFKGEELTGKRVGELRGRQMVLVPQSVSYLDPLMKVGDQVRRGHKDGISRARSREVLGRYGLGEETEELYPFQLSGGQRQRVMIAMALVCKPEILIADEPTTALDVTIQAQILDLMNQLKKETGTSILFITHDLGVVAEVCDDVAVMYCGRVVERGDVKTIFANPSHPYTKGLLGSIPRLGDAGKELKSIPGNVPNPKYMPKGCKFEPRCPYASEKCREEEPGFFQIEEGHISRCWLCESGQLKTDHVEKAGD